MISEGSLPLRLLRRLASKVRLAANPILNPVRPLGARDELPEDELQADAALVPTFGLKMVQGRFLR